MKQKSSQTKNKKKAVKAGRKPPTSKSGGQQRSRAKSNTVGGHQLPLIVGIDPANETSGISLILTNPTTNLWVEELFGSTVSVWDKLPDTLCKRLDTDAPIHIFYEVPPFKGRYTSDSISRAAGMLIQSVRFFHGRPIPRTHVHGVLPTVWRKEIYDKANPMDPKTMAIETYTYLTKKTPTTHDAAEAYLIALYGFKQISKKKGTTK